MGRISTGVGLISGINSKDIIDQLIQLEQAPKTLLQSRKNKVAAQKDAYSGIGTSLSGLQSIGRAFERPTTFTASNATSSDENVLTATTAAGAAIGSYQFQVARLVTAQQSVTTGFADPSAAVGSGPGALTVEMGGGNLNARTELATLNGGAGVRRGLFRVTDRSGKSAVIDTTSAITVDDVVKRINTSLDISVRASVSGDKLVLTDGTGATTNDLKVEDLADGHAAADLGIVGTAPTGTPDTLTGSDVVYLGANLSLASLNDGRGVRVNATGADFVVTARDGSTTNVTLGQNLHTLGDVIKAINTAGGAKFKAQLGGTGNGIQLVDTTGGGGSISVTAAGPNSHAAADLGLVKTGTGATLTGDDLLAGLDTVLVASLQGGRGLALGTISVTDRSGTTRTVNLGGAKTVQDILDAINSTAGLKVSATLKASANGIQIADTSGGTGNLVIADGDANNTATALGLAGTFDTTKPAALGANLQLQWVSESTLLSSYNGGKGVTPGVFTITNSAGKGLDIDLSAGTFRTIGDVVREINSHNAGVAASINANGDGLLLTDTAAGAGKLKVENKTGTTATDLNLVGTAAATGSAGTIDGSFEKTIALTGVETLASVQTAIQQLGFGVSASLLNDGSGAAPYRLSLTAFNSGRAGRVVFDAGGSNLQTTNLVEAQDAAVFYGSAGSSQPLLITSSKNQLANVIPGVTIDLHGASTVPVSLNVTRDADTVVDQVKKFVDGFNGVVDKISDLTKFDTDTNTAGLLLGEGTIQDVQSQMYVALQGVVKGAGRYRILADIGITLGDKARLQFDEDKFRAAFADDPEAVKNLFSQTTGTGLSADTQLTQLNGGRGISVSGGNDFQVTTKDGGRFNVSLPPAGTIADVLSAINTAAAGKVTAAISTDGKGLTVTDNTTGGGAFTVGALNGSLAASQLGLATVPVGKVLTGTPIYKPNASSGGGIGYLIDRSFNALIDPVDGVISRQNKTLDERAQQFQNRMDQLDKLIADKRTRLEQQFANMENVLAGLQSQQQALGSLGAGFTAAASSSSSSSAK